MNKLAELRAAVVELRDEAVALSELDDITPEQDARLDEVVTEIEARQAEIDKLEARQAVLDRAAEAPADDEGSRGFNAPQVIRKVDTDIDARTASPAEVRSVAMKHLEQSEGIVTDSRHLDAAENLIKRGRTDAWDGDKYARQIAITERADYRDAWLKTITGSSELLTDRERSVLSEARAMSLTDTSGGFAVPVVIDPTVLITDGTGLTGILPYCRVEPVNNDAWKGVSAAHTVWGGRAEGVEAGDDSSTFAQPTVNVHTTDAFVPASIEITMDFPGFVSQVGDLIADGYMDFVAEQLAVGAGDASNEGWGVFITTMTTVDVTTDNTFGAPDIDKVWAALGERFRSRATWFMNVDQENDIRGFGSGTATSRFTVDQTREGISVLNGRPVVLSDWAPTWTGTDAAKILTVGDFSKFLFAQRVGMTLEYIPHLFSTGNGRPTGQRGWYAYARYGHDKVVQNAFRVLKNITT